MNMRLSLETSRAVRCTERFSGSAKSFIRAIVNDQHSVMLMANASWSGFELSSADLSSGLLDIAENVWANQGDVEDPAETFARIVTGFAERIRALSSDSKQPVGWLTQVEIRDGLVRVTWLGADEVWLVSDGGLIQRTYGHLDRRERPGLKTQEWLARGVGGEYLGTEPESLDAPWPLCQGQRLLVLNQFLIRELSAQDIVRHATTGTVEEAANALVNSANAKPYAAAIVIQVQ
ncbi:hypothetical protein LVJ94_24705 [Pendulispora rubella]|uniref:PPM-type phosphatase domain-containing protein n=1 Tax=Pendulispora rubella TaxID=2741070 RepID=A0ABZ2LI42_9BACT